MFNFVIVVGMVWGAVGIVAGFFTMVHGIVGASYCVTRDIVVDRRSKLTTRCKRAG